MFDMQSPQAEYMTRITHPQQANVHNLREYDMTPMRDVYNLPQSTERRTPDTYGRSKLNATNSRYPGDYEDIYADQAMYKRPVSPLAYTNIKKANPAISSMQRTYTPVSMLGLREAYQHPAVQMRKPASSAIPRPHSADFLEYEVTRQADPNLVPKQQPRPKSSLDINRNTLNDNYFYSEERYAENMRKSAQYLPKMPRCAPPVEYLQKRSVPQQKYAENVNSFPLMRSTTQPLHFDNLSISDSARQNIQPPRSRSVLSEGSLTKELDMGESVHESYGRASVSPAVLRQEQYYNQDPRRRDYDQFTRSASARLVYNGQNEHMHEGKSITREGEKKVNILITNCLTM